MHQRLVALALLFSICAPPVHSLRVYSHVYKTNEKKWGFGKAGIVDDALNKLEQQWPGGDKSKMMLSKAMYSHSQFDPDVLRQKLSKKLHAQEPFIFATFGSSVSAGHDNWANHSWPLELERILKPVFQELDFDFEMRQRAMGGYGEMPFHGGCLQERAGPGEVDAVSWEFDMFGDPECEKAHFFKSVAHMDSDPALIIFRATDIKGNFGEGEENETARAELRDQMLERKNEEGWHFTYHPQDWFFTEDFISNAEAARYHAKAKPHMLAPLEQDEESIKGSQNWWLEDWGLWGTIQKSGVKSFYGVVPAVAAGFVRDDPWYTAREKAFNINWHPGPLGHKLLASQVAHFLLTELKKELEGAAFTVRAKGPGAGPTADNPLVHDNEKADDRNSDWCGKMETQSCRNGIEPSSEGGTSAWRSLRVSQDTWQYLNTQLDQVGPLGKQIDSRTVWRGTPDAGELQLEVEVPEGEGAHVVFCGRPCGWGCEAGYGYVSSKSQTWWQNEERTTPRKDVSDLAITVDGNLLAPSELLRLHKQLFDPAEGKYCPGCEPTANLCQPASDKLSPGKHTIGLRVEPRSYADKNMHVDILQMMLVG